MLGIGAAPGRKAHSREFDDCGYQFGHFDVLATSHLATDAEENAQTSEIISE